MNDGEKTRHEELTTWLAERGHTPAEIAKILDKVAEYDARTIKESIFDSIDSGDFNLTALIQEALGKE